MQTNLYKLIGGAYTLTGFQFLAYFVLRSDFRPGLAKFSFAGMIFSALLAALGAAILCLGIRDWFGAPKRLTVWPVALAFALALAYVTAGLIDLAVVADRFQSLN